MTDFLLNLSRVIAHTLVYESSAEVPAGVKNDFILGFGFGTTAIAGLLEGKPTIPAFDRVDLGTSQQKAITNNISALPGAENLTSQTNQFGLDQVEKMLSQTVPGYDAIRAGVSKNIASMVSGEIPTDVSDAVQSSAAARALGGGFAGTGTARNLVARDLGLTSLDLTQKGLGAASAWLTTMAKINEPGQINLSSMFITPGQQQAADVEERNSQFQHDYVSNLNDWQHSFGYLAGEDVRDTGNTIGQLLASYMGGSYSGSSNTDAQSPTDNGSAAWGGNNGSAGFGGANEYAGGGSAG